MMDQMNNHLKLKNWVETWADVLVFQALEIPYLSNLNQMGFLMEVLDFLQQSNTVITNVLWLCRFVSNYQFVSFGGCFWIFGGSNNLDSIFWFHYVSCFCQQKKIRGAALGTAAGAFFAFIFQTQHSYLRYSKREMRYVNKLFRIACYTHKHE